MSPSTRARLEKLAWVLGLVAGGLALMALVGHEYLGIRQSTSWPSTPATLLLAQVATYSSRNSNKATYAPEVEYEYEVDGKVYTSDNIAFGGPDFDRNKMGSADDVVKRWRNEPNLVAYYDPAHPDRACLQPGGTISFGIWGLFAAGVGLTLLGLFIATRRSTDEAAPDAQR